MDLKFSLMQELNVRPTLGLDAPRALVRIVAVTTWDGLPTYMDAESYLTGFDEYDAEMKNGVWYGLRCPDEKLHDVYGVMYLPESLVLEILDAGGAAK